MVAMALRSDGCLIDGSRTSMVDGSRCLIVDGIYDGMRWHVQPLGTWDG